MEIPVEMLLAQLPMSRGRSVKLANKPHLPPNCGQSDPSLTHQRVAATWSCTKTESTSQIPDQSTGFY
jgi:hypothetical protein